MHINSLHSARSTVNSINRATVKFYLPPLTPPSHLEELVDSHMSSLHDAIISSLIWMKMYLTEAAFLPALRGGRAGGNVAQRRPEDEGAGRDWVAARGDSWGSETVPATPTPHRRD